MAWGRGDEDETVDATAGATVVGEFINLIRNYLSK